MRKINTILFLLVASLYNSCQDVVDINVDSESPRLVFDAILKVNIWGVDEDFHIYIDQLIDQSEEAYNPFFQISVTTVRGNILKVEDINNIETFDNVGRPQEFV